MGKSSLQNQALAIAFSNAFICLLITYGLQWLTSTSNTSSPQQLTITITGVATGVSVGIGTFILLQLKLMLKQIKQNVEDLKTQIESVVQVNHTEQDVDLYVEFLPLQTSVQQTVAAIKEKLNQSENKLVEQAKKNQYLEKKILEIVHNLDLTDERKLWEETALVSEDEIPSETATGSLLEFLDNFHKWSQLPTAPELLLGSSSIEEIQQRKEQLQYRQVWLQAILEETQREIKFITPIAQLANTTQEKPI